MAKRTRTRKKRGVVEVMVQSADRTGLVTGRMKELYRKGKSGVQREQEGQKDTASPEEYAAEQLEEEMEQAPQAGCSRGQTGESNPGAGQKGAGNTGEGKAV